MRNILVTGAAGFIGTNLIERLLKDENNFIVGVDNLDPYYDTRIKLDNIKSNTNKRFVFEQYDVTNEYLMRTRVFEKYGFDAVIHLAAQAGVSYSIEHTQEIIDVNIKGFDTMVRLCANNNVKHFVFASSSSVLGDHDGRYVQKSPYAVTKATNELQAHMYSILYPNMKFTGLRLYTVYGKRMRPDLAISKFVKAIQNDEEIHVYGDGSIKRDFTYIDDVTNAFETVINNNTPYKGDNYRTFDVGNGKPITVNQLIEIIKNVCGKNEYNKVIYENGKPYDAVTTCANISPTFDYFDDALRCKTSILEGINKYVKGE